MTAPLRWAAPALALVVSGAAFADEAAVRVELGRRLFYDADLSINGTMSCATCHEQRHGFSDGNRTHPGALGDPGKRNAPGLANVGAFRNLTWASDADGGLAHQALTPLLGTSPIEMGSGGHEAEVVARFAADACYRRLFAAAYPGRPIGLEAITAAIAAFEGEFVARDARYDHGALESAAETGRQLFFARGCADCHRPPYFTDDAFHRVRDEPANARDGGLKDATGREADRDLFRTAPLRNVAITAPYWHDGRAATLAEAIALHETPKPQLSPQEIEAVIAFLNALTDETLQTNPRLSLPPAACPLAP